MNPLSPEELKRLRDEYKAGNLWLRDVQRPERIPVYCLPRLLDMVDKLQAKKKKADTLAKAVKAWRDGQPDDSLRLYREMIDAMVDYRRRKPRRQALGLEE